jgi:hypothetical protein
MADKDKAKLVTGLFKSKVAAEAAVDAILKHGFSRDDISVLMSDDTRSKHFALQSRTHAAVALSAQYSPQSWQQGRRCFYRV